MMRRLSDARMRWNLLTVRNCDSQIWVARKRQQRSNWKIAAGKPGQRVRPLPVEQSRAVAGGYALSGLAALLRSYGVQLSAQTGEWRLEISTASTQTKMKIVKYSKFIA